MSVTSSTIAGVPVFQFSGVVTETEIRTAWAGTISEGRYVLNKAIYLDATADLTQVTGGMLVDFGTQVLPAFIIHTSIDRTKQVFKNFIFVQRTGLTVAQRALMIRGTDGTVLTDIGNNGLAQDGGGFVYAVAGVAPGGGDNRYLNELPFDDIANATIMSQEFTEQELQVISFNSKPMKGARFEKAYGFPQIGTPTASVAKPVYRSTQNTQSTVSNGLIPIRLFPSGNRYASVCYIDSYVTRNSQDITINLVSTFGTNASNLANLTILNNYTREGWFGVSKTTIPVNQWFAGNTITGGVLKKLQFIGGEGGVVRCYDSRSTTVPQKSLFKENGFIDFLDPNTSPVIPTGGRIDLMHVGATASGATGASTATITRYTGQKYVYQKFGDRVLIAIPDMTSGDNDLSAYAPILPTIQNALTRTQAQIQAATTITTFNQVLEELHNLAIVSVGSNSYNAPFDGNFFSIDGKTLNTAFTTIEINPLAAQKIAYDGSTNKLTIKSASIASDLNVTEWKNADGLFSFLNGAEILGVFADNDGSRVNVFNLEPENFGVTWNLRYKKIADSTWTELTGTGNSTTIIIDSLSQYDLQARVAGYTWKSITFNPAESLSVDMGLVYHVADDGTPQYLKPFNASLVDIFEYNDAEMSVEVTNTTGSILQPGFNEMYQVIEKVQQDPLLVWSWVNPVTTNSTSQKVLVPPTSPLTLFLSVDSDASVKITCPVVYSDTGISADDKVKGNPSGYSIILGSSATADSSLIVSQLVEQLGGMGYNSDNHSLVKIKVKVDKNLTKTQYLGLK